MRLLKTIAAVLCITFLAAEAVTAESMLSEDFAAFGISSIGIYTEGYEDERVEDFETAYMNAYVTQNVNFFRYTLCNFEPVTPKLMTPGYPVSGAALSTDTDALIGEDISDYLQNLDWKTGIINDFAGGSLKDLLADAAARGHDALLVARYFTIENFIPFSGYSRMEGYSTITTSAKVGKLTKGLGLLPAFELYDTATGARIWYSAYYTGHVDGDDSISYQTTVNNAETFFLEGGSAENAAEMMTALALETGEFPPASASGTRDDAAAKKAAGSSHLFWTDYPEYNFFGTLLGIGYSFGYIGDFNLYYRDNDVDSYNADGNELPHNLVGTTTHNLMHTMTIPMFTFSAKNISFDPGFYFGFMQPKSTTINYTALEDHDDDYLTDEIEVPKTAEVSAWGLTVGMDVALKYYLRFTDTVSAFVGGRALAEAWLVTVSSDVEGLESFEFANRIGSLIPLGDFFTVNASVIAGVRLDTKTPLEFFGMVTPVGPGGKPMITAGVNWHGINFGWTAPHAESVEPMMRW